jgi:thiamine biosynthesis lipoprotein
MLLEYTGYGPQQNNKKITTDESVEEFILPKWSIAKNTLTLNGPAVFDFGGFGKGYCIDQVANILKRFGYKNFIIDAGGDIFATTKKEGAPWKVAIEYPGKPELALGTVLLKNQGIAVSDSFRRRWGKWNHLINPKEKETIERIIGGVAVADCALDADCMTSVLFFSTDNNYHSASEIYKAKYLLVQNDGFTAVSPNWEGELF